MMSNYDNSDYVTNENGGDGGDSESELYYRPKRTKTGLIITETVERESNFLFDSSWGLQQEMSSTFLQSTTRTNHFQDNEQEEFLNVQSTNNNMNIMNTMSSASTNFTLATQQQQQESQYQVQNQNWTATPQNMYSYNHHISNNNFNMHLEYQQQAISSLINSAYANAFTPNLVNNIVNSPSNNFSPLFTQTPQQQEEQQWNNHFIMNNINYNNSNNSGIIYASNKSNESSPSTLDNQINDFLRNSVMNESDYEARCEMLNEIQGILNFGRLHAFGSLVTGLSNPESDLDVYFEDEQRRDQSIVLPEVARVLTQGQGQDGQPPYCHDSSMKVFNNPDIRVHFIRFTPLTRKIQCDLSFKSNMGVRNSRLVAFLLNFHPVARPLALLCREWARSYGLLKVKALKSYAVVLLVIFLLTRKGLLPTVEFLQSLVPPLLVEPECFWNTAFCTDVNYLRQQMGLDPQEQVSTGVNVVTMDYPSQLIPYLIEFFDLLISLKPHDMVCTVSAKFIPRHLFRKQHERLLPPSQQRFLMMTRTINRGFGFNEFPSYRDLCIQDPFDLSHIIVFYIL